LAEKLIAANAYERIFLVGRSESHLRSTALSLRSYGSSIDSQTQIEEVHQNEAVPIQAGVVVIALKDDYDPRDLLRGERLPYGFQRSVRTIGIKRDLPQIHDICRRLDGYAGRVAVLTNPVDIFTALVKEWIPTAEVYGLGVTVDAARLVFCARQRGISCQQGDCPLGGVHIGKLVQLRTLWNPASGLSALSSVMIEDLLESAGEVGPAIVEGLGYTLHDCASVFAKDVTWLAGRDPSRRFLCASVGDRRCAVAKPLVWTSDSGRIETYEKLSENENLQLARAAKLITEATDLIKTNPFFGYRH
jgi:hypothetical protein